MLNRHQRAIIYIICTALLWSAGGFLIKGVEWNPLAIAGVRSGIAAIVLGIYSRRFQFGWSPVQLGGALAYAATVITFVTATKLTTAANAILLQYTAPVYVAVFSFWFLGERISRVDWLTLLVTLSGMVLFFQDRLSTGGMMGNLIAIGSGIAFAALCLFSRKQKKDSPLVSLVLGNIITTLICLPFMFRGPFPGAHGWMALVILGTLQLGLSYIFYAKALQELTALEAILIPVIEPVLNPVWVFLLVHEVPGPNAIWGGLIILIAVAVRCIGVIRKEVGGEEG